MSRLKIASFGESAEGIRLTGNPKSCAHLERCQQCESSPFNLCSTGVELISAIINDTWKPKHPKKRGGV